MIELERGWNLKQIGRLLTDDCLFHFYAGYEVLKHCRIDDFKRLNSVSVPI